MIAKLTLKYKQNKKHTYIHTYIIIYIFLFLFKPVKKTFLIFERSINNHYFYNIKVFLCLFIVKTDTK